MVTLTTSTFSLRRQRVLSLYLNSDTFINNQADKLADIVMAAKEEEIDIIIVHEQDIAESIARSASSWRARHRN